MAHIQKLTLQNFRSYETQVLELPKKTHIVLNGENGAGKTNILEALSLLAPGRGLRNAKISDIQNRAHLGGAPWVMSCNLDTDYGIIPIGTKYDRDKEKRLIKINGQIIRAQSELAQWLSCLWLTPQMDRLFLDDKSARRRFFDRLVFTFDPGHIGRLTRYENATRQRLKLLKDGQMEDSWLSGLESQMAETGIAICASRHLFCQKLQNAYQNATDDEKNNFPSARLSIIGDIENKFNNISALDAEDHFKKHLSNSRKADQNSGMTNYGPHRSDFSVTYIEKNMPAAESSTGEQKALLIGIILAHARLLKEEHNQAPILLLDEIVAHLDPNRRRILAEILANYSSQIWMTGTDQNLFEHFQTQSSFFSVSESNLSIAS